MATEKKTRTQKCKVFPPIFHCKFTSKEKAIDYAKKNNISFQIVNYNKKKFVIKPYENNFTKS